MRQLKLRALYDGKLYPVIGLRYADVGENLLYIDTPENGRIYNPTCIDKLPEILLIQFTGLLDKNGKEIYEGDVIIYQHQKYDIESQISEIIYDCDCMAFMVKRFLGNQYITSLDTAIHTIEVIGNIYENPDLAS